MSEEKIFCTKCGAMLSNEDIFCSKCGAKTKVQQKEVEYEAK